MPMKLALTSARLRSSATFCLLTLSTCLAGLGWVAIGFRQISPDAVPGYPLGPAHLFILGWGLLLVFCLLCRVFFHQTPLALVGAASAALWFAVACLCQYGPAVQNLLGLGVGPVSFGTLLLMLVGCAVVLWAIYHDFFSKHRLRAPKQF